MEVPVKAYRFLFPQLVNGKPDTFDVEAQSVRIAVKLVFKEADKDALGTTLFEGKKRRELGTLRLGPTLYAGWRPVMIHKHRLMDVLPGYRHGWMFIEATFREVGGRRVRR